MSQTHVKLEEGIATLSIANPPLNILTRAVMAGIRESLQRLAKVPELRVLLVLAEGNHFSAGADVGEHLPPSFRELIPEVLRTVEAVAAFPLPVIAVVRGRCLGAGFELAQACDLVVAGQGASFGQPEIGLAVTAPAACVLLPRRIGHGHAAELLFGGDSIDAGRALALGVVLRVVPDADLEECGWALAERIARHSAAALRATKRTMLQTADYTRADALRKAGEIYLDELMACADPVEGLKAFLAKRAPVWRHR